MLVSISKLNRCWLQYTAYIFTHTYSHPTPLSDTLRRVFTECVLPWAIRYFTKEKTKVATGMSKKDDDNPNSQDSRYLSSEADLEEYDTFGK